MLIAFRNRLTELLQIAEANLKIYEKRITEINNDPKIKNEIVRKAVIHTFEIKFISKVGMTVQELEGTMEKLRTELKETGQEIGAKQEQEKSKN